MGKYRNDEDARTFRITARRRENDTTFVKEVVALYHQHENDFIVFKDLGHAAVYTIAAESVLEIERLRTDVILAISEVELNDIIAALGERAMWHDINDDDSTNVARITATIEGLERLRPTAAGRSSEDLCSIPRVQFGQPGTSAPGGSFSVTEDSEPVAA